MIKLATVPKYIKMNRKIGKKKFHFDDAFSGFERVGALKKVFGKRLGKALSTLEVHLYPAHATWGYMWVNKKKGVLVINEHYLRYGKTLSLYLDIIHELVHIKQYSDGLELFDESYDYVDRPTEIEAYKTAVRECKRLGMNKRQIVGYLRVPGWISGRKLNRLCKNIGL